MAKSNQITIRLNEADNVVVARTDILPGAEIGAEGVTAAETIPAGHKVAVAPIKQDEAVRKYNQIIGFASADIDPGRHVHTENCEFRAFARDHAFCSDTRDTDYVTGPDQATFQGFVRANGAVGTRNYIGVLTSVNCSATVARYIAERFPEEELARYPNVDGVAAFVHSTGCGMASSGDGFANLQRVLWGFARHPNFAGILLVGLGCEVNQVDFLLDAYNIKLGPAFQTMTIQGSGGTQKTIERGVDMIRAMLPEANKAVRETVPASHLTLALQCGGSDAYSGITANPSLGAAADLLVRHGGAAILSETPEIYGAEHLLTRRAVSDEVGRKLVERIEWWENYTRINDGSMDNNPSPGNKKGGLTTILEKSLGAAAKGGTTNLTGVYRYAETVSERGFAFMDSPGYDPCSITGQVAAGANVICFTTGRGSVYGCKPAPCLKLATNTPMYRRMEDDMDINCGRVVDGEADIAEMGQIIFDQILATASGERTKSEKLGFGDDEFIPWQIGAVM
ncbi:MAG: altronate dehydratase family protein [Alphaproteobacteria bacterium]|nr:altronate dehydratase family protein [Alphaproteobacteria bacterium]